MMNNMEDPVIQSVNDYIEECELFNKEYDDLAEYFNDNLNGILFCFVQAIILFMDWKQSKVH